MSDTAATEHWATSTDREIFHGAHATWWDAVLEATTAQHSPDAGVYVGLHVPPMQPDEQSGLGSTLIEHIACQDDYHGDWADGWPATSDEQDNELDIMISAVLAAWLDKHKLRPKWFTVPASEWKTRTEALEAKERYLVERETPTS